MSAQLICTVGVGLRASLFGGFSEKEDVGKISNLQKIKTSWVISFYYTEWVF